MGPHHVCVGLFLFIAFVADCMAISSIEEVIKAYRRNANTSKRRGLLDSRTDLESLPANIPLANLVCNFDCITQAHKLLLEGFQQERPCMMSLVTSCEDDSGKTSTVKEALLLRINEYQMTLEELGKQQVKLRQDLRDYQKYVNIRQPGACKKTEIGITKGPSHETGNYEPQTKTPKVAQPSDNMDKHESEGVNVFMKSNGTQELLHLAKKQVEDLIKGLVKEPAIGDPIHELLPILENAFIEHTILPVDCNVLQNIFSRLSEIPKVNSVTLVSIIGSTKEPFVGKGCNKTITKKSTTKPPRDGNKKNKSIQETGNPEQPHDGGGKYKRRTKKPTRRPTRRPSSQSDEKNKSVIGIESTEEPPIGGEKYKRRTKKPTRRPSSQSDEKNKSVTGIERTKEPRVGGGNYKRRTKKPTRRPSSQSDEKNKSVTGIESTEKPSIGGEKHKRKTKKPTRRPLLDSDEKNKSVIGNESTEEPPIGGGKYKRRTKRPRRRSSLGSNEKNKSVTGIERTKKPRVGGGNYKRRTKKPTRRPSSQSDEKNKSVTGIERTKEPRVGGGNYKRRTKKPTRRPSSQSDEKNKSVTGIERTKEPRVGGGNYKRRTKKPTRRPSSQSDEKNKSVTGILSTEKPSIGGEKHKRKTKKPTRRPLLDSDEKNKSVIGNESTEEPPIGGGKYKRRTKRPRRRSSLGSNEKNKSVTGNESTEEPPIGGGKYKRRTNRPTRRSSLGSNEKNKSITGIERTKKPRVGGGNYKRRTKKPTRRPSSQSDEKNKSVIGIESREEPPIGGEKYKRRTKKPTRRPSSQSVEKNKSVIGTESTEEPPIGGGKYRRRTKKPTRRPSWGGVGSYWTKVIIKNDRKPENVNLLETVEKQIKNLIGQLKVNSISRDPAIRKMLQILVGIENKHRNFSFDHQVLMNVLSKLSKIPKISGSIRITIRKIIGNTKRLERIQFDDKEYNSEYEIGSTENPHVGQGRYKWRTIKSTRRPLWYIGESGGNHEIEVNIKPNITRENIKLLQTMKNHIKNLIDHTVGIMPGLARIGNEKEHKTLPLDHKMLMNILSRLSEIPKITRSIRNTIGKIIENTKDPLFRNGNHTITKEPTRTPSLVVFGGNNSLIYLGNTEKPTKRPLWGKGGGTTEQPTFRKGTYKRRTIKPTKAHWWYSDEIKGINMPIKTNGTQENLENLQMVKKSIKNLIDQLLRSPTFRDSIIKKMLYILVHIKNKRTILPFDYEVLINILKRLSKFPEISRSIWESIRKLIRVIKEHSVRQENPERITNQPTRWPTWDSNESDKNIEFGNPREPPVEGDYKKRTKKPTRRPLWDSHENYDSKDTKVFTKTNQTVENTELQQGLKKRIKNLIHQLVGKSRSRDPAIHKTLRILVDIGNKHTTLPFDYKELMKILSRLSENHKISRSIRESIRKLIRITKELSVGQGNPKRITIKPTRRPTRESKETDDNIDEFGNPMEPPVGGEDYERRTKKPTGRPSWDSDGDDDQKVPIKTNGTVENTKLQQGLKKSIKNLIHQLVGKFRSRDPAIHKTLRILVNIENKHTILPFDYKELMNILSRLSENRKISRSIRESIRKLIRITKKLSVGQGNPKRITINPTRRPTRKINETDNNIDEFGNPMEPPVEGEDYERRTKKPKGIPSWDSDGDDDIKVVHVPIKTNRTVKNTELQQGLKRSIKNLIHQLVGKSRSRDPAIHKTLRILVDIENKHKFLPFDYKKLMNILSWLSENHKISRSIRESIRKLIIITKELSVGQENPKRLTIKPTRRPARKSNETDNNIDEFGNPMEPPVGGEDYESRTKKPKGIPSWDSDGDDDKKVVHVPIKTNRTVENTKLQQGLTKSIKNLIHQLVGKFRSRDPDIHKTLRILVDIENKHKILPFDYKELMNILSRLSENRKISRSIRESIRKLIRITKKLSVGQGNPKRIPIKPPRRPTRESNETDNNIDEFGNPMEPPVGGEDYERRTKKPTGRPSWNSDGDDDKKVVHVPIKTNGTVENTKLQQGLKKSIKNLIHQLVGKFRSRDPAIHKTLRILVNIENKHTILPFDYKELMNILSRLSENHKISRSIRESIRKLIRITKKLSVGQGNPKRITINPTRRPTRKINETDNNIDEFGNPMEPPVEGEDYERRTKKPKGIPSWDSDGDDDKKVVHVPIKTNGTVENTKLQQALKKSIKNLIRQLVGNPRSRDPAFHKTLRILVEIENKHTILPFDYKELMNILSRLSENHKISRSIRESIRKLIRITKELSIGQGNPKRIPIKPPRRPTRESNETDNNIDEFGNPQEPADGGGDYKRRTKKPTRRPSWVNRTKVIINTRILDHTELLQMLKKNIKKLINQLVEKSISRDPTIKKMLPMLTLIESKNKILPFDYEVLMDILLRLSKNLKINRSIRESIRKLIRIKKELSAAKDKHKRITKNPKRIPWRDSDEIDESKGITVIIQNDGRVENTELLQVLKKSIKNLIDQLVRNPISRDPAISEMLPLLTHIQNKRKILPLDHAVLMNMLSKLSKVPKINRSIRTSIKKITRITKEPPVGKMYYNEPTRKPLWDKDESDERSGVEVIIKTDGALEKTKLKVLKKSIKNLINKLVGSHITLTHPNIHNMLLTLAHIEKKHKILAFDYKVLMNILSDLSRIPKINKSILISIEKITGITNELPVGGYKRRRKKPTRRPSWDGDESNGNTGGETMENTKHLQVLNKQIKILINKLVSNHMSAHPTIHKMLRKLTYIENKRKIIPADYEVLKSILLRLSKMPKINRSIRITIKEISEISKQRPVEKEDYKRRKMKPKGRPPWESDESDKSVDEFGKLRELPIGEWNYTRRTGKPKRSPSWVGDESKAVEAMTKTNETTENAELLQVLKKQLKNLINKLVGNHMSAQPTTHKMLRTLANIENKRKIIPSDYEVLTNILSRLSKMPKVNRSIRKSIKKITEITEKLPVGKEDYKRRTMMNNGKDDKSVDEFGKPREGNYKKRNYTNDTTRKPPLDTDEGDKKDEFGNPQEPPVEEGNHETRTTKPTREDSWISDESKKIAGEFQQTLGEGIEDNENVDEVGDSREPLIIENAKLLKLVKKQLKNLITKLVGNPISRDPTIHKMLRMLVHIENKHEIVPSDYTVLLSILSRLSKIPTINRSVHISIKKIIGNTEELPVKEGSFKKRTMGPSWDSDESNGRKEIIETNGKQENTKLMQKVIKRITNLIDRLIEHPMSRDPAVRKIIHLLAHIVNKHKTIPFDYKVLMNILSTLSEIPKINRSIRISIKKIIGIVKNPPDGEGNYERRTKIPTRRLSWDREEGDENSGETSAGDENYERHIRRRHHIRRPLWDDMGINENVDEDGDPREPLVRRVNNKRRTPLWDSNESYRSIAEFVNPRVSPVQEQNHEGRTKQQKKRRSWDDDGNDESLVEMASTEEPPVGEDSYDRIWEKPKRHLSRERDEGNESAHEFGSVREERRKRKTKVKRRNAWRALRGGMNNNENDGNSKVLQLLGAQMKELIHKLGGTPASKDPFYRELLHVVTNKRQNHFKVLPRDYGAIKEILLRFTAIPDVNESVLGLIREIIDTMKKNPQPTKPRNGTSNNSSFALSQIEELSKSLKGHLESDSTYRKLISAAASIKNKPKILRKDYSRLVDILQNLSTIPMVSQSDVINIRKIIENIKKNQLTGTVTPEQNTELRLLLQKRIEKLIQELDETSASSERPVRKLRHLLKTIRSDKRICSKSYKSLMYLLLELETYPGISKGNIFVIRRTASIVVDGHSDTPKVDESKQFNFKYHAQKLMEEMMNMEHGTSRAEKRKYESIMQLLVDLFDRYVENGNKLTSTDFKTRLPFDTSDSTYGSVLAQIKVLLKRQKEEQEMDESSTGEDRD